MAEINEISCEVRRWRWNRVGHVLRKEGAERLFYGIGVDTRKSKGERENKDHLVDWPWPIKQYNVMLAGNLVLTTGLKT